MSPSEEGMADYGGPRGLTRRVVLGAMTAAAATLATDAGAAGGALGEAEPLQGLIDVHHHLVPPVFLGSQPSFPPWVHGWRLEHSLEAMDRNGIATAISSLPAPGLTTAEPGAARALARGCNEYAARLGHDHPGRFGMFAAVAPLDTDGALGEIAYALDVLGAQGIGLMTSYGKTYPASHRFDPLFEELNRRGAVVFVHPGLPDIGSDFDPPLSNVPLEMPFDTARALLGMILAGTFTRYPDINFIFNHGGGALPAMHQRMDLSFRNDPALRERFPDGLMAQLRNVYFDTINVLNPANFAMLRQLVAIDRLMFGTDFPGHPAEANTAPLAALSPAEARAIARDNALRLFPALAAAAGRA
jgi:predicted TIM-barrel fold metal-dependent hydrolase